MEAIKQHTHKIWQDWNLLNEGWERINVQQPNVKPGDDIVNGNGLFGTLLSITPSGKYSVRYDIDSCGEKPTYFTAEKFSSHFLVDKRPR